VRFSELVFVRRMIGYTDLDRADVMDVYISCKHARSTLSRSF